MTLFVDHSHLGRHVTGLERITLDLFSGNALAPLALTPVTGGTTLKMLWAQLVGLPLKMLLDQQALALCPGFPPSIPLLALARRRTIAYIHDCFLLTRPDDLNWRARHYMAPAFRHALKRLDWFLVNSGTTRDELRRFCKESAEISLYRPVVRDVFGMGTVAPPSRHFDGQGRLSLIAVGTIEPRKNLAAAAEIVGCLRQDHGIDASLDLVGRPGWGGEADRLKSLPGVNLHGYSAPERVRELLSAAHVFISTSHDEGLGLPLIEAQYAGLPVVAPDKPVFREVLANSGLFIDPAKPKDAAAAILAALTAPDVFAEAARQAAANIHRWNTAAAADRDALVARLQKRT